MNLRKTLLSVTSLAFAGFLFTAPVMAQDDQRTAGAPSATVEVKDNSDTYKELNLFGDVFERVRAQYVDEVPDDKLVANAINGMLVSLDPHSSYMDEKDFAEMQVQTRGEFGGLGIEVTMENGIVKVVSPIDDTPAYRAGVKAGDYITHIDGEPVVGYSLSEAVDKMRGKVGTDIKLTLRREGVPDPIDVTITRDVIEIQAVHDKVIEDSIGYIRISSFSQNTDSGLKKGIKDIKEKTGDKLQGIVIDLRNNPGGLLDQAIAVADDFLDKGEIVSTRGRHDYDTKRDNATPGDIANGLPIVVLINGGSASASEIVSGALQDHRRAVILGTQSFGKGSVQTVIPLPGHGAMRLTTARYYTPSGRSIQAKGITPDIMVEPARIEPLETIEGIHEADLKGALANPNVPTPAEKKPAKAGDDAKAKAKDNNKDKAGDKDAAADNDKEITREDLDKDYQLSRAVDLIRGVSLYESRMVENTALQPQPEKTAETKKN